MTSAAWRWQAEARFSIEFEPDRLDDRGPARDLFLDEMARLLRCRVEVRLEPRRAEQLLQFRIEHRGPRGLRNLRHDRRRCACRRQHTDEISRHEAGKSRL